MRKYRSTLARKQYLFEVHVDSAAQTERSRFVDSPGEVIDYLDRIDRSETSGKKWVCVRFLELGKATPTSHPRWASVSTLLQKHPGLQLGPLVLQWEQWLLAVAKETTTELDEPRRREIAREACMRVLFGQRLGTQAPSGEGYYTRRSAQALHHRVERLERNLQYTQMRSKEQSVERKELRGWIAALIAHALAEQTGWSRLFSPQFTTHSPRVRYFVLPGSPATGAVPRHVDFYLTAQEAYEHNRSKYNSDAAPATGTIVGKVIWNLDRQYPEIELFHLPYDAKEMGWFWARENVSVNYGSDRSEWHQLIMSANQLWLQNERQEASTA